MNRTCFFSRRSALPNCPPRCTIGHGQSRAIATTTSNGRRPATIGHSGMSLIAIIVLLLFIGMSAVVSSSLVGTGNIGGANVVQSAQALSLSHAGKEWYLERLQGDSNWSDETDLNNNALGTGQFDIDVTSTNPTRVIFSSTGKVVNPEGLTVRRRASVTAWKLPPAFQFALYHGSSTAPAFGIQSSSTINGDVWSTGSVTVASSTVTNGLVYVPTGRTVTGASFKIMPVPSLAIPTFTSTIYTTLMSNYDVVIPNSNPPGGNLTINPPSYTVSGTVIADNIITNTVAGTLTINGCGQLVAWQSINLNNQGGGGTRTLNINPTCGDIELLAGENLNVGTNSASRITNLNTGTGICILYSEARSNTNQAVFVNGANTRVHGARIYARRRITVTNGADVDQGSLLYIDRASSAANNQIDITDSGTIVFGTIISTGQNQLNLRIRNSASVTGLVYSNDTGGTGRLELNTCTVTGSVVADLYRAGGGGGADNRILAATVTYDSTVLPDPPPEGFEGFVMRKPDSWDGL